MKIIIIFPGRTVETAKATALVMPLAPALLAALTPPEHQVTLVDMVSGDTVDFEAEVDLVAITIRTPLAPVAYEIADRFREQGTPVVLGGPHTFVLPEEVKQHATSVAIGEGETLWPIILEDAQKGTLKDYYVCGPYNIEPLGDTVVWQKNRPPLEMVPALRRDLLPRKRYLMDSMFTTRGCPNNCRFCPVTKTFGGKIRHRPIDDVVGEVETLGRRYYNFDDSVFGHPQLTDRPQENQYYLDLYRELAEIQKRRLWTGAGGISAINYPDGRRIIELAARSGLSSIAAGLESISKSGQQQSGAWRKLHYSSHETFDVEQTKTNIRVIQSLGIEVMGFFIIGWDSDAIETYRRTLEFCDELDIIPFIFTLTPMPGSQIYNEYLEQGRMLEGASWADYGGSHVVFRHPSMSPEEMIRENAAVMKEGYSTGRILKRTWHTTRRRKSLSVTLGSLFTQLDVKKAYQQLFAQGQSSL